ncbi:MAG: alpha/beta fold hydrolase [Cyclobacteriaceae bacterium]
MIQLIRTYFRVLSALAPALAGRQAFNFFQKTRKKTIRKNEQQFYNLSRHFTIEHHRENIDCYELGNPNDPLVLLVHGWDSNAGSMAAIAFELVEKGHYVVAFNLPAHGFSKLKRSNLIIGREYFRAVVEKIYPAKPFSIIAHSFGSVLTAFSLSDSRFKVDKLIFLANPNKFGPTFEAFRDFIGLGDKAYKVCVKMAEELVGVPMAEMNVEDYSETVKYNRLLLIHDKLDKVVPYERSLEIKNKWHNTELVTLEKIGHYRMLWNEYVIQSIVKFLEPAKTVQLKADLGRIAS